MHIMCRGYGNKIRINGLKGNKTGDREREWKLDGNGLT